MKIEALQLLTPNLRNTREFYSKKLGLEIIKEEASSISFRVGSSALTFIEAAEVNAYYHFAFNIPANKIEEALDWIKPKVEILPFTNEGVIADYPNWNAKALYFLDLTGNIVEFIARLDLDNQTKDAFSVRSLLSISEIGLVVDDVHKSVTHLQNKYGLPVFNKQKPMENFAAIGDDDGLLIVVNKEKKWFPTQIAAKAFATETTINNNGETFELVWDNGS
jgi:catechol-2,3-dioxygenase